jgi:hypothetical protein
MMPVRPTPAFFFAAICFCVACVFLGAQILRTVAPDDRPVITTADTTTGESIRTPIERGTLKEAELALAIERDPFSPHRGGPPAAVEQEAAPTQPTAEMAQLIGTVALPEEAGVAMIRWASEPARLVRVGQSIATWTLQRVEPGTATLVAPDGSEVVLRVPRPGR